jgi:hypothetical protein
MTVHISTPSLCLTRIRGFTLHMATIAKTKEKHPVVAWGIGETSIEVGLGGVARARLLLGELVLKT